LTALPDCPWSSAAEIFHDRNAFVSSAIEQKSKSDGLGEIFFSLRNRTR